MPTHRLMTLDNPLPKAFFPVSLNLTDRPCVVIGDDQEALEKEAALREVGARVRRVSSDRDLSDKEIAEVFFLIATPQDPELAARLKTLSERYRFLLCTIDQPRYGFVAMQAIVRAGPARIGISTGGVAPRVGKILRAALQRACDATFELFLDCLATQKLRNRTFLADDPTQRRRAMIEAAEGFTVRIEMQYPHWFQERLMHLRPQIREIDAER